MEALDEKHETAQRKLIEQVAAFLIGLGAATSDRRFLRAAAALQRSSWGRPSCDDDAQLDEMQWQLESERARSVEQAAGFVASANPKGEQSFEAARDRLARKYRRKFPTK